jgi:hypothetical protein
MTEWMFFMFWGKVRKGVFVPVLIAEIASHHAFGSWLRLTSVARNDNVKGTPSKWYLTLWVIARRQCFSADEAISPLNFEIATATKYKFVASQ